MSVIDDSISFEELISIFEENNMSLEQVPQRIVDKVGYACLANSLMFKEPKIPKYDIEIKNYIENHSFKTLNSLISYISKLDNDIDKLFGIFSYAALNIEYDSKHKSTTLEEIFQTNKAVCSGYSIFFRELAKKVNIDTNRIIIKEYSNFAKGHGYNETEPPQSVESDHSSVYILIDGVPFISEPTWAAGHVTDNKEFEKKFKPHLFLIPIYKTLCNHFPCKESEQLLPFKFKLKHFTQAIDLEPSEKCLKTESNPNVKIKSNSGKIRQTYSCVGPINNVSFKIFQKNGSYYKEIETVGITSYEIIQMQLPKHPNRCRFKTYISLPKPGFYMIKMYIDTKFMLVYYVNNFESCQSSIPILFNPFNDIQFVAISPKKNLISITNGYKIIRFAVSKTKSRFIYEIMKLRNKSSFNLVGQIIDKKKYAEYVTLQLPFDNDHYEVQLCVVFPSNGRCSVSISFVNENNKYNKYVRYYFDVTGANNNKNEEINPVYYNSLCKGRKFTPAVCYDKNQNQIFFNPSQSCYYVEDRNQTLNIKTTSINDDIYFELKKDGKTLVWPKLNEKINGGFRQIKFEIPNEYGDYHLKGWINDDCCINLTYIYGNLVFKEASQNELDLMEKLRETLNQNKLSPKMKSLLNQRKAEKAEINIEEMQIKGNNENPKCENNNNDDLTMQNLLKENECLKKENENLIIKNESLEKEIDLLKKEIQRLKNVNK